MEGGEVDEGRETAAGQQGSRAAGQRDSRTAQKEEPFESRQAWARRHDSTTAQPHNRTATSTTARGQGEQGKTVDAGSCGYGYLWMATGMDDYGSVSIVPKKPE